MPYDDELVKAIRRKIAPDELAALKNADTMSLISPRESVRVPLRADVKVAYDKNAAAFCVVGRISDTDPEKWLTGTQYFSTREISRASDKAAIIDYLFESMKRDFLHRLAEGELEELMGKRGTT